MLNNEKRNKINRVFSSIGTRLFNGDWWKNADEYDKKIAIEFNQQEIKQIFNQIENISNEDKTLEEYILSLISKIYLGRKHY
jgi:hypothetical protein